MIAGIFYSCQGANPMRRFLTGSGGFIRALIASNTTLNFVSYFCSSIFTLRARSALEASNWRRWEKARMISMFT